MTMAQILREKRKALGMTQEQVADYLGVTAPAVNKWEKGTTCPDIALLPALARLLKTDPNTLLQFQETLSREEISRFLMETAEAIRTDGIEQGFETALAHVREFPNCAELLYMTAITLDGALMMSSLAPQEKEDYEEQVFALYEKASTCDDPDFAEKSRYLLASKWITKKQYDKAQEMLDLLPLWSALDKRGMQADVWGGQGEPAKAAALLEQKLMQGIQDHQGTICRLIRLAVQEGDEQAAWGLAECGRRVCKAFQVGEYWENLAPLEAATGLKDAEACITALAAMLDAAPKPMNSRMSPLFRHILSAESPAAVNAQIVSALLTNLEQAPEYAFLRGTPEFEALLRRCRP